MNDDKLLNWVSEQTKKGYSRNIIKKSLKDNGYDDATIDFIFNNKSKKGNNLKSDNVKFNNFHNFKLNRYSIKLGLMNILFLFLLFFFIFEAFQKEIIFITLSIWFFFLIRHFSSKLIFRIISSIPFFLLSIIFNFKILKSGFDDFYIETNFIFYIVFLSFIILISIIGLIFFIVNKNKINLTKFLYIFYNIFIFIFTVSFIFYLIITIFIFIFSNTIYLNYFLMFSIIYFLTLFFSLFFYFLSNFINQIKNIQERDINFGFKLNYKLIFSFIKMNLKKFSVLIVVIFICSFFLIFCYNLYLFNDFNDKINSLKVQILEEESRNIIDQASYHLEKKIIYGDFDYFKKPFAKFMFYKYEDGIYHMWDGVFENAYKIYYDCDFYYNCNNSVILTNDSNAKDYFSKEEGEFYFGYIGDYSTTNSTDISDIKNSIILVKNKKNYQFIKQGYDLYLKSYLEGDKFLDFIERNKFNYESKIYSFKIINISEYSFFKLTKILYNLNYTYTLGNRLYEFNFNLMNIIFYSNLINEYVNFIDNLNNNNIIIPLEYSHTDLIKIIENYPINRIRSTTKEEDDFNIFTRIINTEKIDFFKISKEITRRLESLDSFETLSSYKELMNEFPNNNFLEIIYFNEYLNDLVLYNNNETIIDELNDRLNGEYIINSNYVKINKIPLSIVKNNLEKKIGENKTIFSLNNPKLNYESGTVKEIYLGVKNIYNETFCFGINFKEVNNHSNKYIYQLKNLIVGNYIEKINSNETKVKLIYILVGPNDYGNLTIDYGDCEDFNNTKKLYYNSLSKVSEYITEFPYTLI
jgi:hypothetical protein